MKLIETHTVTTLPARIRIQEYGPLVFKTLPTRSSVKKAIKKGLIYINGDVADTSNWIEIGQHIEVFQEEAVHKIFSLKLNVLFEDDHLAVINKPSGYATSGNYFQTIEHALPFNLKISEAVDALLQALPVHRLDNPTSGVLLVAKTKSTQVALNRQFQDKHIQKTYLAIVEGQPPQTLNLSTAIEGKTAESQLQVLKPFNIKDKAYSLVNLFPKTGRTHQLRIHCAEAGFPIVGDSIYGKKKEKHLVASLMLHASTLEFQHPETHKPLKMTAEAPKRFRILLNLS